MTKGLCSAAARPAQSSARKKQEPEMKDIEITPIQPRTTVRVKTLQRASRRLEVVPRDPQRGQYLVASASQPGVFYSVDLDSRALAGRCTCPWAQHGGVNCKHVLAAL